MYGFKTNKYWDDTRTTRSHVSAGELRCQNLVGSSYRWPDIVVVGKRYFKTKRFQTQNGEQRGREIEKYDNGLVMENGKM